MPLVGAAISGLGALVKLGHGIAQGEDAKYRAARNRIPMFDIEQEYFDNQSIAENLASGGFTDKTVSNFNSQNERGLQASIDATLQGGGGPNSVNGAYSSYLLGNRNFAAADSEKQIKNIQDLYERNKDLAGQKTMQWTLNEYKPATDEAAAIAKQKEASIQNISGAIAEGTAIASSIATANANNKLFPDEKNTGAGASALPQGGGGGTLGDQFADYHSYLQEQENAAKVDDPSIEALLSQLSPEQKAALIKGLTVK